MAVNSDTHDSGAARLIHSLARLNGNADERQIPLAEWSRRLQPAGAKSLRALRAKAAQADDDAWRAFCASLGASDTLGADVRAAACPTTLVPASQTDIDVLRALASPPLAAGKASPCAHAACSHSADDLAISTPTRGGRTGSPLRYTPYKTPKDATMTRQDRERFAWPADTPYQTLLTEDGSIVRSDLSKQMRSLIDASEQHQPSAADPRRTSFGEPETLTAAYATPESTPKSAKGRSERGARRTARAARRRGRREQASDSSDSAPTSTRSSSEDDEGESKRPSRTVTASGRKVTKRRRLSADESERPEPRPAAARPARLTRPIQADSPLRTRDYWITALNTLLARYPRNHVIVSETEVDPSGQPRLFCLDCERSYATGPGRTLQNFEKHLRRYGVHGLNPQSAAALQRQQQRAERERMAKEAEAAAAREAAAAEADAKAKDEDEDDEEEEDDEEKKAPAADAAEDKKENKDEDKDDDADDASRSSSPANAGGKRLRPAADGDADGEAADGGDAASGSVQQRAAKIARVADRCDVSAASENGTSKADGSSSASLLADEELHSPRPGTPHRRPLSEHAANSVTGVLSSPRKLMSPVEMLSPRLTSVQ